MSNITDRDRLILEEPEKMCDYCCNFDKEHIGMDGTALCKLTMTLAYAEDYGGNCMFYNVPKEQIIVPPVEVGQTVYVITDCSHIIMYFDNDYLTGTGAIECPFEDVCNFTDCNDDNTQVLETYVNYMGIEDGSKWYFCCEHINRANDFNKIGKTVFLTKKEAEAKLKELENNG